MENENSLKPHLLADDERNNCGDSTGMGRAVQIGDGNKSKDGGDNKWYEL